MPTVKQLEKLAKKAERGAKEAGLDRVKNIIIAKFEQNPVLYDRENAEYKDPKLREEIITGIAQSLTTESHKYSSTDVSNLWKNLRDGIVKEKQTRNKENVSGLKGNNRKPFPFYDQMQFVEPYVRHRRSLCTTDGDGEDGDASQNDVIENEEEEETLVTHEIANALIEVVMVTDSEGTNLQPSEQVVTEAQSIPGNDAAKDHLFGAAIKRKNTKEPAPAAKKSVPLSSLPVLSPAKQRGVHLSRSTAKERDNINNGLKQALDQIQKSMTAVSDPDAALGESIVAALSAITDIDKKKKWRRFLRQAINDMEDECKGRTVTVDSIFMRV